MHPEYLFNNDTQDISRRVSELATANEPLLRAHCQEVSHQVDTSSLCLQRDCAAAVNDTNAVLSIIGESLNSLSQSLAQKSGVFRTQDGKASFPTVCRTVVQIEEARGRLLACISTLSQLRGRIASSVAEFNRALHFLSLAERAVPKRVRGEYAEFIARTKDAYARLTAWDANLREAQMTYMTIMEQHLPAFMQNMRTAADFNHAGEGLDGAGIRSLCFALSVVLSRLPNVSF